MLALSSDKFSIPYRTGQRYVDWTVISKFGEQMKINHEFSYTIKGFNPNTGEKVKATFIYNELSVKANPRTLRVYGAEQASKAVSIISQVYDSTKLKDAYSKVLGVLEALTTKQDDEFDEMFYRALNQNE